MPGRWPRHPIRPVVAAVVIRPDTGPRPHGPDHRPQDATLCLSCGHVRRVLAPSYVVTRMRRLGARCVECPPVVFITTTFEE